MNSIKKNLFYLVIFIVGFFICGVHVYATDCDKYGCATCVYTSGSFVYNYDIKSNGDGTLNVEFTHNNVQGTGGIKSSVSNSYFINSKTNKIECYPIYTQSDGGRAPVFTAYSENANGRTKVEASSSSTNNNKTLTSEQANVKLCSLTDTVTTKTNTTCNLTINDNKLVSVDCGNRTYNSAKSDISGVDFSKDCSSIKLYMYCDVNQPYCTLNKDAHFGDTTQGTDTETGDVTSNGDYTCNYIGQISGKRLTISKKTENWEIQYNGGSIKIVSTNKVGANIFPSNKCEDVFYLSNKTDSVRTVGVDGDRFSNEQIAGYCRGYDNDVEQFCANGKCNIKNPLCGSSGDTNNDSVSGECPRELRPIIYFVKKVAFNTVRIFVPILLILMGTIDFVKAVMANDDKAMKDSTNKFIKRILAAILLFFIVTIVTIVMDMFTTSGVGEYNDWKACWHNID